MKIFETKDYRKFVQHRIENLPAKGRGTYRRLALHLKVHSSLVSQIFSGSKALNLEQAFKVADFFGLSQLEREYLFLLVEVEKAGTQELKAYFENKISEVQKLASQASSRISNVKKINESSQAIFYSHWLYSAIRLLTSIPSLQTIERLSSQLKIPTSQVRTILDFLLEYGLVVEERGKFNIGPMRTHLPAHSPLAGRHHTNWRLKAIEHLDQKNETSLNFTSPMTLSSKDATKIRKLCLDFIESLNPVIEPSPCEKLYCLNLDWFELNSDPLK